MTVSSENRLRWRSILLARMFKGLFFGMPDSVRGRLCGWFWRLMFLGPDGKPHRAAGFVLAELRRVCFFDRPSIFDANPQVMAYREGARRVFLVIMDYLNLDESEVRKLMELDDGLGE